VDAGSGRAHRNRDRLIMSAPTITVHLRAADGATFDITVPGPHGRSRVRIASIIATAVATTKTWDGTKWVAN
jgi:hypothetical protein